MDIVSIIMPVYNGEKYLEKSVYSVISQSYKNWELIIVDDCSSDRSRDILKKLKLLNNSINVIFLEKNLGSSGARNKALKVAHGKFIAFLDCDDIWEKNFLEEQIRFLKEKNATLVYSSYKIINEKEEEVLRPYLVKDKIEYKDLLKYDSIGMLTALYDTQKIKKEYFDTTLGSTRDDYVYWLKMMKKIEYAYANPEILAKYRIHENGVTSKKYKMIIPQFKVYYKNEKLGLLRTLYYLLWWGIHGIKKYYIN